MYDSYISRGRFFGRKRSTYTRVNTVVTQLRIVHEGKQQIYVQNSMEKLPGMEKYL